jgi:hypothetical protein
VPSVLFPGNLPNFLWSLRVPQPSWAPSWSFKDHFRLPHNHWASSPDISHWCSHLLPLCSVLLQIPWQWFCHLLRFPIYVDGHLIDVTTTESSAKCWTINSLFSLSLIKLDWRTTNSTVKTLIRYWYPHQIQPSTVNQISSSCSYFCGSKILHNRSTHHVKSSQHQIYLFICLFSSLMCPPTSTNGALTKLQKLKPICNVCMGLNSVDSRVVMKTKKACHAECCIWQVHYYPRFLHILDSWKVM